MLIDSSSSRQGAQKGIQLTLRQGEGVQLLPIGLCRLNEESENGLIAFTGLKAGASGRGTMMPCL